MPSIDIHVQGNISKNHEDNFIGGTVVFYSKPSEDFVKYMLDNSHPIPTVPCNRKGDGCDTHITELQAHNGHVPDWSASKGHTEADMVNYAARIVNATMEKCQSIGVDVVMVAKEEENFTYEVSNLDIKTEGEALAEMAMEDQAIEDMEKNEESDDDDNLPF